VSVKLSLTAKDGSLAGKAFEFTGPRQFVIGRGRDCGLCLSDDFEFRCISRHHCLVEIDSPVIRVRDLGSRNGTCINGVQIGRPVDCRLGVGPADEVFDDYFLRDGDELKVGYTAFQVDVTVPGDDASATHEVPEEAYMGACI
jgi:pSer/pThr/pTyr-binding forkhead associated (FHA) protein